MRLPGLVRLYHCAQNVPNSQYKWAQTSPDGKGIEMQTGQIKRVGNCWMLRYYEPVLENGKVVNRRKAKKIATYGDEYRTKADVEPLAKKFLATINAQVARPQSSDTVLSFIE